MYEMRGLGFQLPSRWPTAKEFSRHFDRMALVRSASGFAPVSLGTPTILNQGAASSCTGFAAVQCAHILSGKPICSPAFSYYNNRLCMGGEIDDSGADPDSVDQALNQFGLCPMADMAYNDARVNDRPGDLAYIAAQQVKCDLLPILESGEALYSACEHVIAVERLPLLIAIEVTPAYDNSTATNGIADDPSGRSRGLHAICGYGTDNGLWTAGSWGTGFGRNGSVLLTPRFLGANCVYAASLEIL